MTGQTQRRLILVRHAKAVEDDTAGDHSRPLNARGREDAAALGVWLAEQGIQPQQACCSTAMRTRETLGLVSDTLGNIPTILRDKLYLAPAGELLAQIQGADDTITELMLVGHNPGMHQLLAMLIDEYASEADAERVTSKFPTAACAVLEFELNHWRALQPQSGRLAQLRWSVDG